MQCRVLPVTMRSSEFIVALQCIPKKTSRLHSLGLHALQDQNSSASSEGRTRRGSYSHTRLTKSTVAMVSWCAVYLDTAKHCQNTENVDASVG